VRRSYGAVEDEFFHGGDLLAVVVFSKLVELRLDVLDEAFTLAAFELA
jgi:hypothetical protein